MHTTLVSLEEMTTRQLVALLLVFSLLQFCGIVRVQLVLSLVALVWVMQSACWHIMAGHYLEIHPRKSTLKLHLCLRSLENYVFQASPCLTDDGCSSFCQLKSRTLIFRWIKTTDLLCSKYYIHLLPWIVPPNMTNPAQILVLATSFNRPSIRGETNSKSSTSSSLMPVLHSSPLRTFAPSNASTGLICSVIDIWMCSR